jgi:non-specific serine/threonine protein kinase
MHTLKSISEQLFTADCKSKGYAYFREERVSDVKLEQTIVTATVMGTKLYKVTLQFNGELFPEKTHCECNKLGPMACKHIAAVLFNLNYIGFFVSHYYVDQIRAALHLPIEFPQNAKNHIDAMGAPEEPQVKPQPEAPLVKAEPTPEELAAKEEERKKIHELELLNTFKRRFDLLLSIKQTQKIPPKNTKEMTLAVDISEYAIRFLPLTVTRNEDGAIISQNIARESDFLENEHVSPEKKILFEFLGRDAFKQTIFISKNYETPYSREELLKSKLFAQILMTFRGQYIYQTTGENYKIVRKLYVDPEPAKASVFITRQKENKTLQLQIEHHTFGKPKTRIQPILIDPIWGLSGDTIFMLKNLSYQQYVLFSISDGVIKVPAAFNAYFETNYLPILAKEMLVDSDYYSIRDLSSDPQKQVYLSEEEESLVIQLRFRYGGCTIPFVKEEDEVYSLYTDGQIVRVHRNMSAERDALAEMRELYIKETSTGFFTPRNNPVDFLFKALPFWEEKGFEIFGQAELKKYKINQAQPDISVRIVSGINWFDVQTDIRIGGNTVHVQELMNLIRKKKTYIQLGDGSIGKLTDEWLKKFQQMFFLGDVKDGRVRFAQSQALVVDYLLHNADSGQADDAFQQHLDRLRSFDKIDTVAPPAEFQKVLRVYQQYGYDWFYFLKKYGFGGILADDMGLGKTIQVLSLLLNEKRSGEKSTSLVVAPTSVVFNWINEAAKFAPQLKILNHTGTERDKDAGDTFANYDVVMTSYGIILRDIELLKSFTFNYVILDESQKIKNPLAKSSRLVRQLKAKNKLCLTGTPVENNLLELWSKFQEHFMKPIQKNGNSDEAQLLRKLLYPFVLRRTKSVVAKELPPKSEIIHYCEMEEEQQIIYNSMRDTIRAEIMREIEEKGMAQSGMKIIEGLLRLRQICNHPSLVRDDFNHNSGKFEEFKDMIERVVAEGHKVLVFSQFVKMLEIIKGHLDGQGISYEYLTGNTKDREACVNNFQNNDSVKVFLISLKAGGFGLNLTAADYVFHYDPWWNPSVENQATDRTHRIGQDKNVFVYKFITKNSVEEKILSLQEKKRNLVETIIAEETGLFKKLTKEDINILFS